jgi:hypothetical protein
MPLSDAVTVAVETPDTEDVLTLKMVLFVPAGTFTVRGTCTTGLSLASATVTPPAGATAVSNTVPVEFSPPVTVRGLSVRELGAKGVPGGTIVKKAVSLVPL